ncbi:MAG: XRE family transcriptional regulator [Capsulimonas sp.]|uniref:helix-turn-helix domain-containing protein n=1 Tax=Capsulimonas sp. TaxID=2494211 RepID=UPI003263E1C3
MLIGKKLAEARRRIGLTLEAVGQKTEIGLSSLSDFENDKREPKFHQLKKLADVYHRPATFFLSDEPFGSAVVLWRQKPTEGAEAIEDRFLRLCEQYRNLEQWTGDVLTPRLPEAASQSRALTYNDAEVLAAEVAKELGLGDKPGFDLMRRLEDDCGIRIFLDSFEPTGTAACVKSDEHGWAILLNGGNPVCRQRYDLAHELFHLLVWGIYRAKGNTASVASEHEEKLANTFASCLLLPREPLLKALSRFQNAEGAIPGSAVPEIARQFGVSIDALVWRIHTVYGWSKDRQESTRALIAAIKADSRSTGAEEPLRDGKFPPRYQSLAIRALKEGEISTGKFAEYMEVSRRHAMSIAEAGTNALDEVRLEAQSEEYSLDEISLTAA